MVAWKARGSRLWDVILTSAQQLLRHPLLRYGAVAVIATVIMIPRMSAPNFGLLDDGVTIYISSSILEEFKTGNIGGLFRFESERGRFKPFNFLYYAIPYAIGGPSPFGFFVVQWLSLIVTGLIICRVVEVLTKDRLTGVLSGILYVLAPPVIESYYTLSKSEPPMVLWLGLSLLFLFKSTNTPTHNRKPSHLLFAASAFFLLIAYFTKETAHAMLLVSALWMIHALWHNRSSQNHQLWESRCEYFIANLIVASIYWMTRILTGTVGISSGEDSEHYQLVFSTFSASFLGHIAWYMRDFFYLFPIFLFMSGLIWKKWIIISSRSKKVLYDFIYWVCGWTIIMLPWHSTLEYYLLPATLGISIIAGIGIREVLKHIYSTSRMVKLSSYTTLLIVFLAGSISLANGLTNGRIQVAVDSANADLIDYLAQNLPAHGMLLVNLPEPNEYVYEIGAHLGVLKQRQDIQLRYFNSLNLSTDAGAFVATPIMKTQPYLTVRLATHEGGAKLWKSDLQTKLGRDAELVYERVESISLLTVAVEKTVCPLLRRANVQDRIYCAAKRPSIETRIFEYGWEVYKISKHGG